MMRRSYIDTGKQKGEILGRKYLIYRYVLNTTSLNTCISLTTTPWEASLRPAPVAAREGHHTSAHGWLERVRAGAGRPRIAARTNRNKGCTKQSEKQSLQLSPRIRRPQK